MSPYPVMAYLMVLVFAETFRLQMRGRFDTAPTALALGLALAIAVQTPSGPITLSAWQVGAMVLGSQVLALPLLWFSHDHPARRAVLIDCALRLVTVVAVAVIVRELPLLDGLSVAEATLDWPGWRRAVVFISALGFVLALEMPIRVWLHHAVVGGDGMSEPGEDMRLSIALKVVLVTCSVILALTQEAIGLAALPLTLILLVVTQVSIRHQARLQRTHRQSVRALARMPELAGLVPTGHSASVAKLSVAVAQEMTLTGTQISTLEAAALLHDLGQVVLRRPIPSGATVLAAPGDQEYLAEEGAAIVVHVGRLDDVAETIAAQATPYYQLVQRRAHIPQTARILKVANAYVDYVGGSLDVADHTAHQEAMERLFLGLGYEYDPKVVGALEKVLSRSGFGDLTKAGTRLDAGNGALDKASADAAPRINTGSRKSVSPNPRPRPRHSSDQPAAQGPVATGRHRGR